jgi:hypothetical protein
VSKKAVAIGVTGAQLDVVWEVGGFATLNPGDSVSTTVASGPKGAPQEWKLVFYPRGFANPSTVSIFVTNVGCLEEKPLPPDTQVSATITLAVAEAEGGMYAWMDGCSICICMQVMYMLTHD